MIEMHLTSCNVSDEIFFHSYFFAMELIAKLFTRGFLSYRMQVNFKNSRLSARVCTLCDKFNYVIIYAF